MMNVIEERGLKMELASAESRARVNIIFFLFWVSVYQFVVAMCFFWVDLLPQFGYANNIHQFWDKYVANVVSKSTDPSETSCSTLG